MIEPIYIFLLVALVVSVTIAMLVLPNILLISHKKRLFDMPNKRKVHHAPIPRLGGLSFFPVMLITMGGLVLVPGLEILWNFWAGIVFFVKIVEMLGCLEELMYICK